VYLRHTTRRKNGKVHVYWSLVRSVRRGRKVHQETVAQLGELDDQGRARAKLLARRMTGGRCDQRELFEEAPSAEVVPVRLDKVRLERSRRFGDVWLAWTLWRALEFDRVFAGLLPEGDEAVPWSTMAAVLVLARLCEPSSELHIAEDWYRRTALEDLLGVAPHRVNDDRLYRALDKVLPHKVALEQHLKKRLGELFHLDYDLMLYDVTSTYFEGLAEGNEIARRGHSRDHRSDCTQVCIALVVTREGMPLGYEVFRGNRTDVTTVEEIVATMEKRFGMAGRVWVMDRGMTSEDNLAWLQSTNRRYLLGTSRAEMKQWSRQLTEARGWHQVREGIEVKICEGPDGKETFLLCRSEDRREKELAMHERFIKRIEDGLRSLGRRIDQSQKPLKKGTVERQIGRLLQRNSRAAGRYQIELVDDPERKAGFRLEWSARSDWDEWARHSEGTYILRTNVNDWTPQELWRTYVQLTDAESAFRIQKSDLSLRPVWHQNPKRIQAHIFVCFLAYALWKTLEQWQRRAELGRSPRTILEEMARITSTDVVLPVDGADQRELRLRCVVRPDKAQAALLDRLGLRLPERLKVPIPDPEM
jgi:transposase